MAEEAFLADILTVVAGRYATVVVVVGVSGGLGSLKGKTMKSHRRWWWFKRGEC